ncbi:tudor domain-containing protein [Myxococcota bacterium]
MKKSLAILVFAVALLPREGRGGEPGIIEEEAYKLINSDEASRTYNWVFRIGVEGVSWVRYIYGPAEYALLGSPDMVFAMAKGGASGLVKKLSTDAVMGIVKRLHGNNKREARKIAVWAYNKGIRAYRENNKFWKKCAGVPGCLNEGDSATFVKNWYMQKVMVAAKKLMNDTSEYKEPKLKTEDWESKMSTSKKFLLRAKEVTNLLSKAVDSGALDKTQLFVEMLALGIRTEGTIFTYKPYVDYCDTVRLIWSDYVYHLKRLKIDAPEIYEPMVDLDGSASEKLKEILTTQYMAELKTRHPPDEEQKELASTEAPRDMAPVASKEAMPDVQASPDVERVCRHMMSLVKKADDQDYRDCVQELGKNLPKCGNLKEVVGCYMKLNNTKYERQCRRMCKTVALHKPGTRFVGKMEWGGMKCEDGVLELKPDHARLGRYLIAAGCKMYVPAYQYLPDRRRGRIPSCGFHEKADGIDITCRHPNGRVFLRYTGKVCPTCSSPEAMLKKSSTAGTKGGINKGDRVSCRWKGKKHWYKGYVARKSGGKIYIEYDDGDREWTTPGLCRKEIAPSSSGGKSGFYKGARVRCRWKGKSTWYDGRIGKKQGNRLYILYDDGDREWTTPGLCQRI